jgi:hypothetical protein
MEKEITKSNKGTMIDGYPEEHELKKIREWPKQDFVGLLEYVRSLWHWDDYIVVNGREVAMYTGGWKGNEQIISELGRTFFWLFCWQMSKRGGHYYFKLPEITKSESPVGDETT